MVFDWMLQGSVDDLRLGFLLREDKVAHNQHHADDADDDSERRRGGGGGVSGAPQTADALSVLGGARAARVVVLGGDETRHGNALHGRGGRGGAAAEDALPDLVGAGGDAVVVEDLPCGRGARDAADVLRDVLVRLHGVELVVHPQQDAEASDEVLQLLVLALLLEPLVLRLLHAVDAFLSLGEARRRGRRLHADAALAHARLAARAVRFVRRQTRRGRARAQLGRLLAAVLWDDARRAFLAERFRVRVAARAVGAGRVGLVLDADAGETLPLRALCAVWKRDAGRADFRCAETCRCSDTFSGVAARPRSTAYDD